MTVSLTLGGGKLFDETAPAKALEGAMPLVEEMCSHLLKEKLASLDQFAPEHRAELLPPMNINDGGFRRLVVTRDDFERLLSPWKYELGRLMLKWPRHKTESSAAYYTRLCQSGDGWDGRFHRMKIMLAHIHRIDEEERAERERERAAEAKRRRDDEERKRKARRELVKQSSPDPAEIKRLLAIVAEAEDIEALLALHDRANEARIALAKIYDKEREACAALGKPVPERSVPGWPDALTKRG